MGTAPAAYLPDCSVTVQVPADCAASPPMHAVMSPEPVNRRTTESLDPQPAKLCEFLLQFIST